MISGLISGRKLASSQKRQMICEYHRQHHRGAVLDGCQQRVGALDLLYLRRHDREEWQQQRQPNMAPINPARIAVRLFA